MSAPPETGWLPDFMFREGRMVSGVALVAGADGRIARVSDAPDDLARAHRLPGRALLPGLVNAHSHSFQRALRGRTERRTGDFWSWREAMYHCAATLTPEDIYAVARMAFLEMAASGITTVGEFHYLHHAPDGTPYENPNRLGFEVVRAALDVGLRIALLRTAYARAGWQTAPNPLQARFLTPCAEDFLAHTEAMERELRAFAPDGRAWVGVAPHSVRAVPGEYLREVAAGAKARGWPVHMHVAEQTAEVDACMAETGATPVEFLASAGVLGGAFTAVHATHITEGEVALLAHAGATICACPSTERNLGDGIAQADRWAAAGVRIALGTDSQAQIDLLEDARELEYHLRLQRRERAVLAPETLFDAATLGGEHSLTVAAGHPAGRGGRGGGRGASNTSSLAPGEPADFFTVDLRHIALAGADAGSLLASIVVAAGPAAVRDVFVNGRAVVANGHHAEETRIVDAFLAVQKKLWGTAQ